MATWPKGRLIEVEGALHEVLMESPDRRALSLETILGHFSDHG
jgi:alpha-beta hydrolase superfamily lysophospholipase